jgi:hypothetical protein
LLPTMEGWAQCHFHWRSDPHRSPAGSSLERAHAQLSRLILPTGKPDIHPSRVRHGLGSPSALRGCPQFSRLRIFPPASCIRGTLGRSRQAIAKSFGRLPAASGRLCWPARPLRPFTAPLRPPNRRWLKQACQEAQYSPWRRAGMAWLCVGRLPRFLCKRERGPAAALHPAPTAGLLRWHVTVHTSLRSGGQRCRRGPSGLPTRGMYVKRASPDGLTGGQIFAPRALARAASHLSIRRTALLVNDLGQGRAVAFRQLSLTQA